MVDQPIHGRGAGDNPANRFEKLRYEPDPEAPADETPAPGTHFFKDTTRTLIATNDSPDVGFNASINPYRGCEHGCIYCYARPYHEYLGLSAGLDFETKIMVKEDAPRLLRRELTSSKWVPQVLGICGVTDPYQPVERRLRLTRGCLEVLAEFRNPFGIVTKNHLVTRDVDILRDMANDQAAVVNLSITTLDPGLARVMEPRASTASARLEAVRELSAAGVPVTVLVAPVIPALTDHEIPSILAAAKEAGARYAGHVLLRLPHGIGPLFENWLAQHFPEKKDKVLSRIKETRGGRLNDPRFLSRMRGEGEIADMIDQVFDMNCRKLGLDGRPNLSTSAFRRPGETQLSLFD